MRLRPIRPTDNAAVATLIRAVMPEFGCVGPGFSIEDPEVDDMYGSYAAPRAGYFVVEDRATDAGGGAPGLFAVAGYAPLAGADAQTCELRKMYAYPAARGRGIGRALLDACVAGARAAGFTCMYLETHHAMTAAAELYARNGFEALGGPLGATGHSGCDRYMARAL